MKIGYYKNKKEAIQLQLNKSDLQYQQLSWTRGILAVLFVGCIFASIQSKNQFYNLLAFACLILFGICVWIHHLIVTKQNFQKASLVVNEQILTRFSDDWKSLQDTGEDFVSESDYRSNDLDIYGCDSLFQYLTCANTYLGREMLASYLQGNERDINTILQRQSACAELVKKQDFAEELLAYSYQMSKDQLTNQNQFKDFIHSVNDKKISFKIMKIVKWIFPLITLFFLGCVILKIEAEKSLAIASLCIVLQLACSLFAYGKISEAIKSIFGISRMLTLYKQLFMKIESQSFESQYLQELQLNCVQPVLASEGIKQLGVISEGVNVRFNAIAYVVCNGLLLWDFHLVESFEQWSNKYGSYLQSWLETVGEMEALISLSTLEKVKTETCVPIISRKEEPYLRSVNMAHPLIDENIAVGNSMEAKSQTWIITGSNMSGKTTFMRTIGTNLILAYAGANVLASQFEASRMSIYTSMRIQDDVSQGISTFYAEILRIKWMVEALKKNEIMISLIDEIFKGTNSADRIVGASEAVKKLSAKQCLTFVSTHDFELCNLVGSENPVVNYHFEEYYKEGQIFFDYHLKKGKCQTTNAQYLLKMAGIMEE